MPKRTHVPAATLHSKLRTASHLPPQRDFSSLSVRDLLDAREAYHVHLSVLDNVVATAIGRYRIYEKDWFAFYAPHEPRPASEKLSHAERTLANSVVRPWSWPCVLVFVREWEPKSKLGHQAVPSRLYMPDGRVIPTCVILAPPDEAEPPPLTEIGPSSEMLGGGFLCMRDGQGVPQYGSIACLAQRHGAFFALTTKHVAGTAGDVVNVRVRGAMNRIGISDTVELTRKTMKGLFTDWPGEHTYVKLDAGLIRVDDVSQWTSQVYGIGEVGEVFDANPDTVTLDLIGTPVRAYGGASGVIEGEIQALFYRYQSLGGYDYVTDVLIGPRRADEVEKERTPERREDAKRRKAHMPSIITHPGDSGTLWFYDPPNEPRPGHHEDDPISPPTVPERGERARRLRPIAMQWGGVRTLLQSGERSAFALGAFLSTVCNEFDVEVERSWSLGHDEYWGKIGHFAVGWKACDLVSGKLGTLMKANQKNIGFGNQTLKQGSEFKLGRGGFVPLVDVPDYVWIGIRQSTEPVQHFADIDIHAIDGGPSMLEACRKNPRNISASVWKKFFDGFASKGVGPQEGVLPFRVWQIWEEMVKFLKAGDVERFVAAAGVVGHYVGDASQPLHCSYLHHGKLPMVTVNGRKYPVPHSHDPSTPYGKYAKTRDAKIHGIYEEGMLEIDALGALQDVDKLLNRGAAKPAVNSGYEAARATFDLMSDANKRLPPMDIINADDPSLTEKQRAQRLWAIQKIRKETVKSLAESTRVLAALWKGAWKAGGGDKLAAAKLKAITEPRLQTIYRKSSFLPSLTLKVMASSGRFEAPAGG